MNGFYGFYVFCGFYVFYDFYDFYGFNYLTNRPFDYLTDLTKPLEVQAPCD